MSARVAPADTPRGVAGSNDDFQTISRHCLTYVSPATHLVNKLGDGEAAGLTVTCMHAPAYQDDGYIESTERQAIKLIVGLSDGRLLEYCVGNCIEDWDSVEDLGSHGDQVSCVVSTHRRLYSCAHDGVMMEWSKAGKLVHRFDRGTGPLLTILALEDELYAGSVRGCVTAWHAYNRQHLRTFGISPAPVLHLCSYNKRMIVSGSGDGYVTLWQRMDGYPSRVLRVTTCGVTSLAVHPDGFAFSSSHPNLASGPLPPDDAPPTAQDVKALAEQRKLHSLLHDSDKAERQLSGTPECFSFDLTTGWKEHKFPEDTTCVLLHEAAAQPSGALHNYLVTGHQDGTVRVWLTQGRSEDTITAGRLLQKWNAELAEAEAELEVLRRAEEMEADIALASKSARRPYFGLSLLLTASLEKNSMSDTLRPGMELLGGSSKPLLARPEATPALNVLFRNSVEYSPELMWSGLLVLNRHVIADELAPSIEAKERVDRQREVIASIRERATEADRSIIDLMAKGQLYKSLSALANPVTAIAAHKGFVFGASQGMIAGWDLHTGRHCESFTEVHGMTRSIVVKRHVMCAVNSSYGVTTWYSKLLASADSPGGDAAGEAGGGGLRAERHSLCILPEMRPSKPCLFHSVSVPAIQRNELAAEFATLVAGGGGGGGSGGGVAVAEGATIPLSVFRTYWDGLEHCGVNPCPTEAALRKWLGILPSSNTVSLHHFSSAMLTYAAR